MNEQQEAVQEIEVDSDEALTVEVPTEIKAGRSSADCYACYAQRLA
jgi:hypothetical protein